MSVTALPGPVAVLGEAPLWDVALARLLWVDCDQKMLFELDPSSDTVESTVLPHSPGSYAVREGGGLLMAYRNRLAILGARHVEERNVETPGVEFAVERFNDGACDRRGRFWVGTMDRRLREPVGSLFRVDADLSLTRIERDVICSNGIAFSPDDTVMYHTDTGAGLIYSYDFDLDSGEVEHRQIFADFRTERGRPDGCTIDVEGCLWVARIGAGKIVRIDPDGVVVSTVDLPVSRPTSAMFGGPELATLFVTSMLHGLSDEELDGEPLAGCLLMVEVGIRGLPEPRFGG